MEFFVLLTFFHVLATVPVDVRGDVVHLQTPPCAHPPTFSSLNVWMVCALTIMSQVSLALRFLRIKSRDRVRQALGPFLWYQLATIRSYLPLFLPTLCLLVACFSPLAAPWLFYLAWRLLPARRYSFFMINGKPQIDLTRCGGISIPDEALPSQPASSLFQRSLVPSLMAAFSACSYFLTPWCVVPAICCWVLYEMRYVFLRRFVTTALYAWCFPDPNRPEMSVAWGYIALLAVKATQLYHLRHSKVGMAAWVADLIREFGINPIIQSKTLAAIEELKKSPAFEPRFEKVEAAPGQMTVAPSIFGTSSVLLDSEPMVLNPIDFGLIISGLAIFLSGIFQLPVSALLNYRPPADLVGLATHVRSWDTLRTVAWPFLTGLLNSMYETVSGVPNGFIPSKQSTCQAQWAALQLRMQPFYLPRSTSFYTQAQTVEICSIVSCLTSLSIDMTKAGTPPMYITPVTGAINFFMGKQLEATRVGLIRPRKMPVALLDLGPAGTGKSTFAHYLLQVIAMRRGIDTAYCPVDPGAKFYDHYLNQPFVIFNDIFGFKDKTQISEEVNFIKHVVDTEFFFVVTAAVETKSTRSWSPEVVFASSNRDHNSFYDVSQYAEAGGVDGHAMARRFPFIVRHLKERVGFPPPASTITAVDEYYDDLQLYLHHGERWVDIRFSQLVDWMLCLYDRNELAHNGRLKDPILYVEKRKEFLCSLNMTKFAPFRNIPLPPIPAVRDDNGREISEVPVLDTLIEDNREYDLMDSEECVLTPSAAFKPDDVVVISNMLLNDSIMHPALKAHYFTGETITWSSYVAIRCEIALPEGRVSPLINGPFSSFCNHMSQCNDTYYRLCWPHLTTKSLAVIYKIKQPRWAPHARAWDAFRVYFQANNTIPIGLYNRRNVDVITQLMNDTDNYDLHTYIPSIRNSVLNSTFTVQHLTAHREKWVAASLRRVQTFAVDHPILGAVILTAGALTVGSTLYFLFMEKLGSGKTLDSEDASGKSDPKIARPKIRAAKRPVAVPHVVAVPPKPIDSKPAMAVVVSENLYKDDPNARDQLSSVMRSSVCSIVIKSPAGTARSQIFFLGGHLGVVAGHMVDKIPPEHYHSTEVTLFFYARRVPFPSFRLADCVVTLYPKPIGQHPEGPVILDLATILVPNIIERFGDIRKMIASDDDRAICHVSKAIVGLWTMPGGVPTPEYHVVRPITTDGTHRGFGKRIIGNCVLLPHPIVPGDCGFPVALVNPHQTRKIIGVLVARSGSLAWASMIPHEFFDSIDAIGPNVVAEPTSELVLAFQTDKAVIQVPPGAIVHSLEPSLAEKSGLNRNLKMARSPFNQWSCERHSDEFLCCRYKCPRFTGQWHPPGCFQYETEDGVWYDPFWAALFKVPYEPLAPAYFSDMYWHTYIKPQMAELARFIFPPPLSGVPAVLSDSETVNGLVRIDGARLIEKIQWKTASGLPWANLPGSPDPPGPDVTSRGKARFLKCEEHGNLGLCETVNCTSKRFFIPVVAAAEHVAEEQFASGSVPAHCYQEFPKVEVRAPGKNPRPVLVCPMHITAAQRKRFLPIFSGMLAKCADPHYLSCVGLNVHSRGYHELSAARRAFGEFGQDGDGSSSDLRIKCPSLDNVETAITAAVDMYFTFDDEAERQTFVRELRAELCAITTFRRSCDGVIFSLLGDFATGTGITIFINTIIYCCVFYGTWAYYAAHKEMPHTALDFVKNVMMKVYGDDWWQVHRDRDYTMHVIASIAKRVYGVEITNPTEMGKDGQFRDHKPVAELEMLKRVDVEHSDGTLHGRLGKMSINRPLAYVNDNSPEATRSVMDSVLLEYYEAGDRAEFQHMWQTFTQFLVEAKLPLNLPKWEAFDKQWQTARSDVALPLEEENVLLDSEPCSAGDDDSWLETSSLLLGETFDVITGHSLPNGPRSGIIHESTVNTFSTGRATHWAPTVLTIAGDVDINHVRLLADRSVADAYAESKTLCCSCMDVQVSSDGELSEYDPPLPGDFAVATHCLLCQPMEPTALFTALCHGRRYVRYRDTPFLDPPGNFVSLGDGRGDLLDSEPCSTEAHGVTAAVHTPVESKPVPTSPLMQETVVTPEIVLQHTPEAVRSVIDQMTIYGVPVPEDITDRWVRLTAFNFTTATTFATILATLHLPDDIVSLSLLLQNRLSGHFFMRCDAEIEIRVNAPPFSCGSFGPVLNPGMARSVNHTTTGYQYMHSLGAYISLGASTNTLIKLPYCSPYNWLDVTNFSTAQQTNACAAVYLMGIIGMSSTGANVPTTVPIEIYGRLKNVVLSGPEPLSTFNIRDTEAHRLVEEYKRRISNSTRARVPLLDSEACSAEGTATPLALRAETPDKAAPKAKRDKKTIVPLPKAEAANKQKSLVAPPPPIPTDIGGQITYGVTSFFSSLFGTVSSVVSSLAPFAGGIVKALFLDKPISELPSARTFEQAPSEHYTRGLSHALTLGTFHAERVASTCVGQPNISDLIQIPVFLGAFPYSAATAPGVLIASWPVEPTRWCNNQRNGAGPFTYVRNEGCLASYCLYYDFWTGSFKLLIIVECPATISGRLMTLVTPPGVALPADCRTNFGQYASQVHEYKGTTKIKITIPALSKFHLIPISPLTGAAVQSTATGGNFGIYNLQSPLTNDTVGSSACNLAVWGAAAPDFKLYRYRGVDNVNLTNATIPFRDMTDAELLGVSGQVSELLDSEPCTDIFAEFTSDFPPLIAGQKGGFTSNMFCPDEEDNLIGLCKRPYFQQSIAASTVYTRDVGTFPSLYLLLNPFQWYRGPIVFRVTSGSTANGRMYASPTYGSALTVNAAPNISSGQIHVNTLVSQELSVELPWMSSLMYQEVEATIFPNSNIGCQISADAFTNNLLVCVSVGDNFGVAGYVGPVQRTVVNAALRDKEIPMFMKVGDRVVLDLRPQLKAEIERRGLRYSPAPKPSISGAVVNKFPSSPMIDLDDAWSLKSEYMTKATK